MSRLSLLFLMVAIMTFSFAGPSSGQGKAKLSERTILVLPFKGVNKKLVKSVAEVIEETYGCKTEILKKGPRPSKQALETMRRKRLQKIAALCGERMIDDEPLKKAEQRLLAAAQKSRNPAALSQVRALTQVQWDVDALLDQAAEFVGERRQEEGVRAILVLTHVDVSRAEVNFLFGATNTK